ncbi:MAG: metalloregulator ArsR/SmtB family transcription factor [Patescibacteria group bacterium]|jgi:ArsR family transcriptional regulator
MDKIFKALSDKNRRRIITLLNERSMSVNEILEHFEVTQATLSSHLAILRKTELVKVETRGKQRIYHLNKKLLSAFVGSLKKFNGEIESNSNKDIIVRRKSS